LIFVHLKCSKNSYVVIWSLITISY